MGMGITLLFFIIQIAVIGAIVLFAITVLSHLRRSAIAQESIAESEQKIGAWLAEKSDNAENNLKN